jgi:urea transporter
MAVCSPISSLFALIGSTVSTLTALGLGVDNKTVYMGLWGYSATLTSIALGGMFFILNRPSTIFYAIFGSILTCIIHGATGAFLAPFGLPALTFAFNLTSWLLCLAGKSVKSLFEVEIT